MPLISPAESKAVGFEEARIDEYPSVEAVYAAPRLQLVRWHRFLRSPHDEDEAAILGSIMCRLNDTFVFPLAQSVGG